METTYRALVALFCILSLCVSTSAKPINHAQHRAIATSSIDNVSSNTVGLEEFAPQQARSRQDWGKYFAKRATTWTVQAGDTGNGIAQRLSIEFIQLAFMNPTVQWKNLQIGQVLNVPCDDASTGARVYAVAAGDTGNAIAAANGITFAQLDAFNPGVDWYTLEIGQTLLIPALGVDAARIAQMVDISSLEQDGAIPPIELTMPTTTLSNGIYHLASISTTMNSKVVIIPPMVNEPISISVTTTGQNAPAAMPLPTDTNDKSPFLTPPGDSALPVRSIKDQNSIVPKLVKLRLIRNEQSADTNIARQTAPHPQPQLPYRPEKPNPHPPTESSGPAPPLPSASTPTTYTVMAGDTGSAIAAAYSLTFTDLALANPGVTWTSLQVGQIINLPTGAKPPSASSTTRKKLPDHKPGEDIYTLYTGSVAAAYPVMSSWIDFETLWSSNLAAGNIGATCKFALGDVPINTDRETRTLKAVIQSVAKETGVNPSFILVIVLQESNGCVRVPTTSSWEGIQNPGLMQSFKGIATCNEDGKMTSPCPATTIKAMVMEGVKGSNGVGIIPGLKTAAMKAGMSWPVNNSATSEGQMRKQEKRRGQAGQNVKVGVDGEGTRKRKTDEAILYYQAARIYNSGSIPLDGDLSGSTGSTRCYVSDIVNRLMGWVRAPKACSLA